MAHGRQEGGLGAVGGVGTIFGVVQGQEQMLAFADVDPAADHAADFAVTAAIRQHPVVDGQHAVGAHGQAAVLHPWHALLHHLQIIGVVSGGLVGVFQHAFDHGLAEHGVTLHAKHVQVAAVADAQPPLAVAHIDRVRRAVDQHAHEFHLVVQGNLRLCALAHQPAQVGDPTQRHQQQSTRHDEALQDQAAVAQPIAVVHGNLVAPAVGDFVHLLRRDAQQGFFQDRIQFQRAARGRERHTRRLGTDRGGDAQAVTVLARDHVARGDQRIDRAIGPPVGHHGHGFLGALGVDQGDVGERLQQLVAHRVAGDDRQALARHVIQGGRAVRAAAADQHVG